MHFHIASLVLATLASTVSAADHQVQVGNGSFTFSPSSLTAAAGDTVTFIFYPKNHTVTQSTFAAPCKAMSGGADSNYQPVNASASNVPSYSITVNGTDPQWFYCKQSTHCTSGMVFAVNPSANKTFEAFQAAAKASSPDGTPSNTTGSSGSPSAASGSASGSAASATSSSTSNGAVAVGARAGGLLAVIGFAAGILL